MKKSTFRSEWDEIVFLYYEIIDWWYGNKKGWEKYVPKHIKRLKSLLRKVAFKHEAIRGEECWSLIYEFEGDLQKAILYRESEIHLMKKLLKLPESKTIKDIIYYSDVHDRLILLALLYDKLDNGKKALKALEEAKKIAKKNNFKFEAQDLMNEIQNEN